MKLNKKESELIFCVCGALASAPKGGSNHQKMLIETQQKIADDISLIISNYEIEKLTNPAAEIKFPKLYQELLSEVIAPLNLPSAESLKTKLSATKAPNHEED